MRCDFREQKQLDFAIISEDARRHHARIIQNHHLVRMDEVRKIRESPMLDGVAITPQHKHARRVTLRRWMPRDQLRR
jgi:hypothetical protein